MILIFWHLIIHKILAMINAVTTFARYNSTKNLLKNATKGIVQSVTSYRSLKEKITLLATAFVAIF